MDAYSPDGSHPTGPRWTAALIAFALTGLVAVVATRRRSDTDAA